MESLLWNKMIEEPHIKVTIKRDEYAESPQNWGNTGAFLVCDNREFNVRVENIDAFNVFDYLRGNNDLLEYFEDYHIFIAHYTYDRLYFTTEIYPTFAFILVKKDEGDTKAIANGMLENWNTYLSGDIWYYEIAVLNELGDELYYDNVGGFYGLETIKNQSKLELECIVAEYPNIEKVIWEINEYY